MDITVAFILKSWSLMALIMVVMWIGMTFLTIKVGDLIDKWISNRKKEHNKNDKI